MRKSPRFTHGFIDRHGKARFYFRRKGYARVPLPGLPWSPDFMAAYEAALKGEPLPSNDMGAAKTKPGSFNALVVAYYKSAQFLNLSSSTQVTYRGIIERFRKDNGDRELVLLKKEDVVRLLGNRASTPSAANNWLRIIRMLMHFAIEIGMRSDDPTIGVKSLKTRSEGFQIWTDGLIARYRDKHPIGSKPRLALELLLNTAQRRSDVVRMGIQHVQGGYMSIRQQKTGTLVEIPILRDLREAMDALPSKHLTFLTTEYGRPFTAAGFGNWFRDRCNEAGIPVGYSAHGLRKAAATRLADHGCTEHEIMAWGGWETVKEVQRYTKAANRRRLADSGRDKLEKGTSSGKPA